MNMNNILSTILGLELGIILAILIITKPYLGIVFTVSSLPIVDLLPSIPYVSSIVPIIGLMTIIGFLAIRKPFSVKKPIKLNPVFFIGVLFLIWVFISNPEAAWFGVDRNWIFTFVQLWVLMFLSAQLVDSPTKQRSMMWIFAVVSIISAAVAIRSGRIGESFETSARVSGLAEGANSAARFFVVAMVFLSYLRAQSERSAVKFLTLIGIIITYLGVFYTVSRSGMVLIFAAQGMILILQQQIRRKAQILVIFIIALILLWLFADSIFRIIASIFPTVVHAEDTMGLRYELWKAAWKMWLDHIFRGVGIGQFPVQLKYYNTGSIPNFYLMLVTHNTYLQILAETGIVGFLIFILLILFTFKNFFKTKHIADMDSLSLRNTWLIIFIVLLLGGITKSDHADKLTWLVMGISTFFSDLGKQTIPATNKKAIVDLSPDRLGNNT